MESWVNKLPNITRNGSQRPSETAWSLSIMMEMQDFLFLETIKKSNAGLLKQMRQILAN